MFKNQKTGYQLALTLLALVFMVNKAQAQHEEIQCHWNNIPPLFQRLIREPIHLDSELTTINSSESVQLLIADNHCLTESSENKIGLQAFYEHQDEPYWQEPLNTTPFIILDRSKIDKGSAISADYGMTVNDDFQYIPTVTVHYVSSGGRIELKIMNDQRVNDSFPAILLVDNIDIPENCKKITGVVDLADPHLSTRRNSPLLGKRQISDPESTNHTTAATESSFKYNSSTAFCSSMAGILFMIGQGFWLMSVYNLKNSNAVDWREKKCDWFFRGASYFLTAGATLVEEVIYQSVRLLYKNYHSHNARPSIEVVEGTGTERAETPPPPPADTAPPAYRSWLPS